MSCQLLLDPDRLHDIVDDLESVYWVLIWASMPRLLLSNQIFPQDAFDEVDVDSEGRTVGGNLKQTYILFHTYARLRLSSKPVEKLVRLCNRCWHCYHTVICHPDDEGSQDEPQAMFPKVKLPSFWLAQFSSILEDQTLWDNSNLPPPDIALEMEMGPAAADDVAAQSHPGTKEAGNGINESRTESSSGVGRKRKVSGSGNEESGDVQQLRRSKRLKLRQP